jgi:integrase
MRLLWETGLRISEALNLRYGDIYPDGINIRHGKGDKQRMVPCQAPILGELLRYRETHKMEKIFQKITTEPGALYMMRRYAKQINLPKKIHPHLFRHSFAINFIRQTGNPFALQDIGGWSDMETIKIYMRLAKEAPREAINKMYFPQVK